MKIKISIISIAFLFALHFCSFSQTKGIQFELSSNWDEVLAKAKAENKFIFVDCFATWCGPCKEMDLKVYSSNTIGNYFNAKFISIRLQMDSSKQDDEWVKSYYPIAKKMMYLYKIGAFPSFLFFSPDGTIVHRSLGYKSVDDFMNLAANSLNPDRQYYTLQEKYKQGEKNYPAMPYLSKLASSLNDQELAKQVGGDFVNNYLFKLKVDELYTTQNIDFIISCVGMGIINSNDNGFKFLFENTEKINGIMGDSTFTQEYIDYLISKEEIDPKLWKDNKAVSESPDWRAIKSVIYKKYGKSYGDRTVAGARVRWYGYKKDWPAFASSLVAKYDLTNGKSKDLFTFDNDLFAIFQYSTNKKELNKAIYWMEQLFETIPEQKDPQNMDTYANLLYKAGNSKEALAWEGKAVHMGPNEKEILENYTKMKNRQPTWPVQ